MSDEGVTSFHGDLLFEGFQRMGMGRLEPGAGVNDVLGITEITSIVCRLDSDDRLTVAYSTIDSDNFPVPHNEPKLSHQLAKDRTVLFMVTSDSLDSSLAIDLERLRRDVAAGGVLGAVIPVVDARP